MRRFYAVLTIVLALFLSLPAHAETQSITVQCGYGEIQKAVEDVATQIQGSIPGKITRPPKVSIKAYNDVMTYYYTCMANVIIYVVGVEKSFYSLYHIHFTSSGKWIQGDSPLPEWKEEREHNDWIYEWCSFIEVVYGAMEVAKLKECN